MKAKTRQVILRPVLREHAVLIAIILLYAACAATVAAFFSAPIQTDVLALEFVSSALCGPVLVAFVFIVMLAIRLGPARVIPYLAVYRKTFFTLDRQVPIVLLVLIIPLFSISFGILKSAIPAMHPFTWDRDLAAWDAALHGGTAPWLWLQPVLGHPWISSAINVVYNLWFFIMLTVLYWQVLSRARPALRMRFLLSFCTVWMVLGTGGAVAMSSAGPCFYGKLVPGPDPFQPLMTYLHAANEQAPIWSLHVQDLLWSSYTNHSAEGPLGISAMPSVHVATSVLLVLLAWQCRPAVRVAAVLFALTIMLGSVHLGWHYALDGYAGAAGALAIWFGIGRLLAAAPKAVPEVHPSPGLANPAYRYER